MTESIYASLWRAMPEFLQGVAIRAVQRNKRLYRWLLFRHVDAKDRANGAARNLPPAELRYRVSSSPDAENFVTIGKTCANDIKEALLKADHELATFTRILDFGCGCGRTLVHLKDLAPHAQFDGTDIDAAAIEWCKQNLNFATFSAGKASPPTEYPSDTFDFIYAISVFTHLDEDYQFRWLEELRRIAKPGGVLLLTVDSSLAGEKDFVFQRSYEDGLFPAWYQNAFHSKKYVIENFGKYFHVMAYLPKGMNDHQDVVMLRKS
ncbi:MAG TPA: class I SAM-dependent methyltransferase [Pyrinomonadaceae bacterium]|nr:class I SAM-dependent methyltransferase [Pyrinomonadaceae bacterium]